MRPTARLLQCNFHKLNHLDSLARQHPNTFHYLHTNPQFSKALFMAQPPIAQFPPSKPSGRIPETHSAFFYGTLMALPILSRVLYGTTTPPSTPLRSPSPASSTSSSSRLSTSSPLHSALPKAPFRITPALLPAHTRRTVRGCDYPGAVSSPAPHSYIRGTLVEGLSAHDIWRLDVFEGDEYARLPIDVHVLRSSSLSSLMLPPVEAKGKLAAEVLAAEGTGEVVKTQGYVFVAGEHCLEEGEWDYEQFTRDKLRRWTKEDKEFVESDAVDPMGGRWFGEQQEKEMAAPTASS